VLISVGRDIEWVSERKEMQRGRERGSEREREREREREGEREGERAWEGEIEWGRETVFFLL
jgi:hypothetical protein